MKAVVCAVDDSAGAAEALRVASRLSSSLGLRLVVAHVAPGYRLPDGPAGVTGRQAEQGAQRLLERVTREAGLNGDAERRAEVGNRATELARVAQEEAAAMIVVGARGQGRQGRKLVSGLAAELNGIAPCAILVAPPRSRRTS